MKAISALFLVIGSVAFYACGSDENDKKPASATPDSSITMGEPRGFHQPPLLAPDAYPVNQPKSQEYEIPPAPTMDLEPNINNSPIPQSTPPRPRMEIPELQETLPKQPVWTPVQPTNPQPKQPLPGAVPNVLPPQSQNSTVPMGIVLPGQQSPQLFQQIPAPAPMLGLPPSIDIPQVPLSSTPGVTTVGRELFIVVAGNASCNDQLLRNSLFTHRDPRPDLNSVPLFANVRRYLQPARHGHEVIYFCYGNRSERMYFYIESQPSPMQEIHNVQVTEYVLGAARYFNQINFIGYSYGGWRVMKTAAAVGATYPGLPINLVTIDPISKLLCHNVFDQGCREIPRDFTEQEMMVLAHQTNWSNFFQSGPFVRSGVVWTAGRNYHIRGNHRSIVNSREVWGIISTVLPH